MRYSRPETIVLSTLCGPVCVAVADAGIIHDRIAVALERGHAIAVSFAGVEVMLACFANAAFGQLMARFPLTQINEAVQFEDIRQNDLAQIHRSFERTARYLANPAAYDAAWAEIVGEDEKLEASDATNLRS